MKISIYKDVSYCFPEPPLIRYILCVDGIYIMHYSINSSKEKKEEDVIKILMKLVLTQPYINDILYNRSGMKVLQGKLVHEEIDTEIVKKLRMKLKMKEIDQDFA